jgi:hypothetical protein
MTEISVLGILQLLWFSCWLSWLLGHSGIPYADVPNVLGLESGIFGIQQNVVLFVCLRGNERLEHK